MRVQILILCLVCGLPVFGCRPSSLAIADSKTHSSQASDYETVNLVTLWLGKDVRVQATIENLREPLSASSQKPASKLVIKNLSSGKIIYEEECGDSSLSTPGFWIDRGAALVMTSRGGSGNGIQVFDVGESEVQVVLDEVYRAAAIMIPNDDLGGDMGFLIVDSEHATDPLQVKRYQYSTREKQFVITGKANFAKILGSIKTQFK